MCLQHSDLFLWLVKVQSESVLLEKQHYLEERNSIKKNKEKVREAKQIILKSLDEILSNVAYFIPYQF